MTTALRNDHFNPLHHKDNTLIHCIKIQQGLTSTIVIKKPKFH